MYCTLKTRRNLRCGFNDKTFVQGFKLMDLYVSVATTPNYPSDSGPDRDCTTTYVAPEGSQIAVNFLDIDMPDGDNGVCIKDFIQLRETIEKSHGAIGSLNS